MSEHGIGKVWLLQMRLATFLRLIWRPDYTPEPERIGIRRAWFLAGLCQEIGLEMRESPAKSRCKFKAS